MQNKLTVSHICVCCRLRDGVCVGGGGLDQVCHQVGSLFWNYPFQVFCCTEG